jgi:hypothetical protein
MHWVAYRLTSSAVRHRADSRRATFAHVPRRRIRVSRAPAQRRSQRQNRQFCGCFISALTAERGTGLPPLSPRPFSRGGGPVSLRSDGLQLIPLDEIDHFTGESDMPASLRSDGDRRG